MSYLIIAATVTEVTPLLEFLRQKNTLSPMPPTDVLITGIGLTATTYSLTRQLRLKRPDCIIQAGVGGCFDTRMPLGTVVAIKKDTIADQSVVELQRLKTLFDLKLVPADQHPYQKGWLVNRHELLKKTKLRKVSAISVNQISTSRPMIRFYREYFDPVIESMEGAALHYVCLQENVPFIQLRSISNYIGERNKKNWDLKRSVDNLNRELIRLIQSL